MRELINAKASAYLGHMRVLVRDLHELRRLHAEVGADGKYLIEPAFAVRQALAEAGFEFEVVQTVIVRNVEPKCQPTLSKPESTASN